MQTSSERQHQHYRLGAFAVLTSVVLGACATETSAVAEAVPAEQLAENVAGVAVDRGPADQSQWQAFLRVERGGVEGPPITMARMEEMCLAAVANGMNMIPIIDSYGLPQDWLNNYGQIEAGGWSVEPNPYGIDDITFWYSRSGAIRNIGFYGRGLAFGGGVSDWMAPGQRCRPGVTIDS